MLPAIGSHGFGWQHFHHVSIKLELLTDSDSAVPQKRMSLEGGKIFRKIILNTKVWPAAPIPFMKPTEVCLSEVTPSVPCTQQQTFLDLLKHHIFSAVVRDGRRQQGDKR